MDDRAPIPWFFIILNLDPDYSQTSLAPVEIRGPLVTALMKASTFWDFLPAKRILVIAAFGCILNVNHAPWLANLTDEILTGIAEGQLRNINIGEVIPEFSANDFL